MNRLLSFQTIEGSFGLAPDSLNSTASVYVTAQALSALQSVKLNLNVQSEIQQASDFLLNNQQPESGWGSSWETAQALLAVLATTQDVSRFFDALEGLRDAQLANSSWDNDVYATGLAIQALAKATHIINNPQDSLASIAARVVEFTTGTALWDVAVSLDPSAQNSLSDQQGNIVFSQLAAGSYQLQLTSDGFDPLLVDVTVQANQRLDLGDLLLSLQPGKGLLLGRVTERENSAPLLASLQLGGDASVTMITNDQGGYRIPLDAGNYTITASADGFNDSQAAVSLTATQLLIFSPSLSVLGSPGDSDVSIRGQVSDASTGSPLATVTINAGGLSTQTDSNGDFSLIELAPGSIDLSLSLSGYQSRSLTIVAPAGSQVELGVLAMQADDPATDSQLAGVINDTLNGLPLSGATLRIDSLNLSVRSDVDGRYQLEGINVLEFIVSVSAPGYLTRNTQVVLSAHGSQRADFSLEAAPTSDISIDRVFTLDTNYPANTEIKAHAVLLNASDSEIAVRLFVQVINEQGDIIEQFSAVQIPLGGDPEAALVLVPPNGQIESIVEWSTGSQADGPYDILVQAIGAQNQLLDEGSTRIQIDITRAIGGLAAFDPPLAQLADESPIAITANISNRGNVVLPASVATATVRLKNRGFLPADILAEVRLLLNTGLNGADHMAQDNDGNVYIANASDNNILRYTTDNQLEIWLSGVTRPRDVDIDDAGVVYVLATNFLTKIQPDLSRNDIPIPAGEWEAMELLSDGRILMLQRNTLYQMATDGSVTRLFKGGIDDPQGIAINSLDEVYIADARQNVIFKISNGVMTLFADDVSQPWGLVFDVNDRLYVAETTAGRISRFTPEGSKDVISESFTRPKGLALSSDGRIAVTDESTHRVVLMDENGVIEPYVSRTVRGTRALAIDNSGNLLVANQLQNTGTLDRIIPGQAATEELLQLLNPRDILPLSNGDMLVLLNSKLQRVLADNSSSDVLTGLRTPDSIINNVDNTGYILSQKHTSALGIYSISSGFELSPYIQVPFQRPSALIPDDSDGVLVMTPGTIGGAKYITQIADDGFYSEVAVSNLAYSGDMERLANGNIIYIQSNSIYELDGLGVSTLLLDNLPVQPRMLAVDAADTLYFAAFNSFDIYRSEAGEVVLHATLEQRMSNDLVVEANGTLWAHHTNRRISKVSPDGTSVSTYPTLQATYSLALSNEGGVYYGAASAIYRMGSDGSDSLLFSSGFIGFENVIEITQSSNGSIWAITNKSRLLKIDTAGSLLLSSITIDKPGNMAYASNGDFLLIDKNVGSLARWQNLNQLPTIELQGGYHHFVKEATNSLLLISDSELYRYDLNTQINTVLTSGFGTLSAITLNLMEQQIILYDASINALITLDMNGVELNRHIGLSSPTGIAFTSSGDLMVANSGTTSVVKRRADSRMDHFYSIRPNFILALDNNEIAVSETSTIKRLSSSGELIGSSPSLSFPRGMALDSSGAIWTANNRTVLFEESVNQFVPKVSGLKAAFDITQHIDGRIFIAESSKGAIYQLVDGNGLQSMLNLPGVRALETDNLGTIYAMHANSTVSLFDGDWERNDTQLNRALGNSVNGLQVVGKDLLVATTSKELYEINLLRDGSTWEPGDLIYQAQRNLPVLDVDALPSAIDFGDFIPPVSGDYSVDITTDLADADVNLYNTLHVGDFAKANFSNAGDRLFPGDQSYSLSLMIRGASTSSISAIDIESITPIAISSGVGYGLTSDSDGNVYAASRSTILKHRIDGVTEVFASGLTLGSGLAIDLNDNIYATGSSNVFQFTPNGEMSIRFTGPGVYAIADDSEGNIFFLQNRVGIFKLLADGSTEQAVEVGPVDPQIFAVNAVGDFFYSDGELRRVSADGQTLTSIALVSFEREGSTLASDCANNLLFAPTLYPPFKENIGEEDIIVHLSLDTLQGQQLLFGPDVDTSLRDMDGIYYDRKHDRILIYGESNGGDIFSFPINCGAIDVSAHILTRSDVDLTSSQPAPTQIIEHADGTAEYIWQLAGVDQAGFSIGLDLFLRDLEEDELRDLFDSAFLEFTNTFLPQEVIRVPIDIPNLLAESNLSISSNLDATNYGPNSPVAIIVNIVNDNASSFNGEIQIRIEDEQGVLVEALSPVTISELAANSNADYLTGWDTGFIFAGDYSLIVTLVDTQGTELKNTITPFTIDSGNQNAGPLASIRVISQQNRILIGEAIAFTVRIDNLSDNQILSNTRLQVILDDASLTTVVTAQFNLPQLLPNTQIDRQIELASGGLIAGNYTLTVDYLDNDDSQLDTTQLLLDLVDLAAIGGEVNINPPTIVYGDILQCQFRVSNSSVDSINALPIRFRLAHLNQQTIDELQQMSINLDPQQTSEFTINQDSNILGTGGFACLLEAFIEDQWQSLASASFSVVANADLAVSISADQPFVRLFDPVNYQLQVSNSGPSDATIVSVQSILPDQLEFSGVQTNLGSCFGQDQAIKCQLGSLPMGSNAIIDIQTNSLQSGSLVLSAQANLVGADNNLANNSVQTSVEVAPQIDVSIDPFTCSTLAPPGGLHDFALRIRNGGPDTASQVQVVVQLPVEFTLLQSDPMMPVCQLSGQTLTCNFGQLAANEITRLRLLVQVSPDAVGSPVSTASISALEYDPVDSNNVTSLIAEIMPELILMHSFERCGR